MNLFKKITIFLPLLLLVFSCSAEKEQSIPGHLDQLENVIVVHPTSKPAHDIELIHSAEIKDLSATSEWFVDWSNDFWAFSGGDSWFGGLEVDDSGRIYVGNRASNRIQVFNSTGRYLSSVGGEGNGPGEFNGITEIKIQNNQLFAFDFLQFRTTFYSLDSLNVVEVKNAYLNRAPNIEELQGRFSNGYHLIDEERFLVRYVEQIANANVGTPKYNLDKIRPGNYYIVNSEGEVVSEQLFELKSLKHITADVEGRHIWNFMPVPFLNQPLIYISDDGHIVSANSDEPLIQLFAPNGEYLRGFYLQLEKRPLIRDELLSKYGGESKVNQHLLQNAELPDTWPALGDIIMDDENRLWISTITESEDVTYKWWVLQDTGELLATFSWPENRSIEKIKDGFLYARETKESTGQQTVVKYRVEMMKIE